MQFKNILSTALVVCLLAAPAVALAQFPDYVTGFTGTAQGGNATDLMAVIKAIVNALLALVGIVAIIYIVIGGVRYLTSQGDESALESAKNTIIYALIGLVIIFISAVVINLVLAQATTVPTY